MTHYIIGITDTEPYLNTFANILLAQICIVCVIPVVELLKQNN